MFYRLLILLIALSVALGVRAETSAAQSARSQTTGELDIEAIQGVLAVQGLDGWLMYVPQTGNPVATDLVAPKGATHPWYYFVPSGGEPSAIFHKEDASAFAKVRGKKVTYTGYRDRTDGLRATLQGVTRIAMEYAPKSGIPSLTRVDAGTVSLIESLGVAVTSSADLVQSTKSLWGPDGRISHYLAVHHLTKLREEVLAFIAGEIKAKKRITEYDAQQLLLEGFKVRGLVGEARVLVAENTAKPAYIATKDEAKPIKNNQLILIDLRARSEEARSIYASLTWLAYVGRTVPTRYHRVFDVVAKARDAAVHLISERVARRRLVKGFEADQAARQVIKASGMASRFSHPTGHSLDTSYLGDGANLDDYETHDTRPLVVGSGFTVGPGVYVPRGFGIQTVVNVYIAQGRAEVTTPVQRRITPLLQGK